MCGIVGLLPRNADLRSKLGELALPMLGCMADRGGDSAGFAVFSNGVEAPARRINVYACDRKYDWETLAKALREAMRAEVEVRAAENHAILVTAAPPAAVRDWLGKRDPLLPLVSGGLLVDVYKDIGHPSEIASSYGFRRLAGTHLVAHTRIATESAVTPAHSHPFTAGEDFCLVHNGSLSNPYSLRRRLEKHGIHFETDNDTEAACRFLEWRMRQGDDLRQALLTAFAELDGFYTLLM